MEPQVQESLEGRIVVDDAGVVAQFDAGAEQIFGYSADEVVGRDIVLLLPVSDEHRHSRLSGEYRFRRKFDPLLDASRFGRRRDGTSFPIEFEPIDDSSERAWNVRYFHERRRTNRFALIADKAREAYKEIAALYLDTQVFLDRGNLNDAVSGILRSVCQLADWDFGAFWVWDEKLGALACHSNWSKAPLAHASFIRTSNQIKFQPGTGLPGRVFEDVAPVWIPDVVADGNFPRLKEVREAGLHTGIGFAVCTAKGCRGVMEFYSTEVREPDQGLLAIIADIGGRLGDMLERVDYDRELRQNEAWLRRILDTALDAVVSMDDSGLIVEWNKRAESMFGWLQHEVIGKPMTVIMPQRYHQAHEAGMQRYLAGGKARVVNHIIEIEALHRHGHEFRVELAIGTPVENDDRKLFTAFIRDISDRAAAERKLRASEERFALAVEGTSDGLWDVDLGTGQVYLSPRFLELLGMDELKTDFSVEQLRELTHPEDQERVGKLLDGYRQEHKPFSMEQRLRTSDGSYKWFMARGRYVFDEEGKPIRELGFITDISEQRRIEQQLRTTYKLEAIGRLAGGIAHDFNNILYALLGYAEFVKEDLDPDSDAAENIGHVIKAGLRAKDLVRRILAFSRQTELEYTAIELGQIVKEALSLLRATLPSSIELKQLTDTDEVLVYADQTQMHQVVVNLCTNAAHAIGDRPGVLEVSLRSIELDADFTDLHHIEPGPYVMLSVSDNGSGIPAEVVQRIFDPFFTTKEPGKGTGMGLALVHGIVRAHNGAIDLYTEHGKGTTFNVYLPRANDLEPETGEMVQVLKGGRERVMLVDDEADIVDMVSRSLQKLGYVVSGFAGSAEALAAFKESPDEYDLVITDQTMPVMKGEVLAEELTAIRPDIPIILCTGFSLALHDLNARKSCIKEYLMKPLVSRELGLAVRRVLDATESS